MPDRKEEIGKKHDQQPRQRAGAPDRAGGSAQAGSSQGIDPSRVSFLSDESNVLPWGRTFTMADVFAGPHGTLMANVDEEVISIGSMRTLMMKVEDEEIPVDLETAMLCTGHGCFQYKLMGICGLIYACCSLSTSTLSLVISAAQYDFNLSSVDKGVLNTAPLWGMVIGSYFWGNFADSKGRKFVLCWSLFVDAMASFMSSFCQDLYTFYVIRVFNGFGIIGATSIVFAYMGEFLDHEHRDKYLARLELFWTFGIISLPLIGMAILPFDFEFGERGTFIYNSWRLFVFTCGVPPFIATLLMCLMPESPRFLLLQGEFEKSRAVLAKMFKTNHGQPTKDYPVKVLDTHPEAEFYHFSKRNKSTNISILRKIQHISISVLKQHKSLFSGRSLINILLTCYIDFSLISVYYTMMLWVPELLKREEKFYSENPSSHLTLCEVSSRETLENDSPKDAKIPMETFLHIIITCLACLPTTFALLILVVYVSKKVLLFGIVVSSAIPAVLLAYVNSITMTVAMLSTLKSFTNLAEAILFCAVVEIFPITTRGTALSLTVTLGRIGSVIGNVVFGLLIDKNCKELFYGLAVLLVSSGLVTLFLPKMRIGH